MTATILDCVDEGHKTDRTLVVMLLSYSEAFRCFHQDTTQMTDESDETQGVLLNPHRTQGPCWSVLSQMATVVSQAESFSHTECEEKATVVSQAESFSHTECEEKATVITKI